MYIELLRARWRRKLGVKVIDDAMARIGLTEKLPTIKIWSNGLESLSCGSPPRLHLLPCPLC